MAATLDPDHVPEYGLALVLYVAIHFWTGDISVNSASQ